MNTRLIVLITLLVASLSCFPEAHADLIYTYKADATFSDGGTLTGTIDFQYLPQFPGQVWNASGRLVSSIGTLPPPNFNWGGFVYAFDNVATFSSIHINCCYSGLPAGTLVQMTETYINVGKIAPSFPETWSFTIWEGITLGRVGGGDVLASNIRQTDGLFSLTGITDTTTGITRSVPEPDIFALMLVGLISLACFNTLQRIRRQSDGLA